MNHVVLAHVKKDAASLRLPLIGWAACVVLSVVGIGAKDNLLPGGLSLGGLGGVSVAVGAFLQYLLLLVLMVRVIHEDSLMEADAFWRTRPIARLELLSAKALFIGILLLVSLSLLVPLTHLRTLSAPLWIFLCSLVAFASVTPNFTRLLVSFLGIGFVAGFFAALIGHQNLNWTVGSQTHQVAWSLGDHLPFLQAGDHFLLKTILIGGLLAVTVHQYLTLRTKLSMILLFGLIFSVGLLWGN